MEKEKRGVRIPIFLLITILFLIIGIIGGLFLSKELFNKNEECSSPKTLEPTEDANLTKKESIMLPNKETIVIKWEADTITKNVEIINNENYFKISDYRRDLNYNDLLNVTIKNIELNGNKHIIKFEYINTCDVADIHKNLYLDDILLHDQKNEACYLIGLEFVGILDNKYIITYYSGEFKRVFVYDESGNEIDKLPVLDFKYVNGNYFVTYYEENDPKYIMNTYKYGIKDGKREMILLEKGTESYCNDESLFGYCEDINN